MKGCRFLQISHLKKTKKAILVLFNFYFVLKAYPFALYRAFRVLALHAIYFTTSIS